MLLLAEVTQLLIALGETPDDAAHMAESVRRQHFILPRRYIAGGWRIEITRHVGMVPDENAVAPNEFTVTIMEARNRNTTSGDSR